MIIKNYLFLNYFYITSNFSMFKFNINKLCNIWIKMFFYNTIIKIGKNKVNDSSNSYFNKKNIFLGFYFINFIKKILIKNEK